MFATIKPILALPQLSCCGPIEGRQSRPRSPGSAAFRNYHVAAPLKVVRAVAAYRGDDGLPQLSCCGPIEGPRATPSFGRARPFRNYHVAAPLKVRHRHVADRDVHLPQLSCCGPIEGGLARLAFFRVGYTFRNYHVAAPLKGVLARGAGP